LKSPSDPGTNPGKKHNKFRMIRRFKDPTS
jgi:hypothetical protein